MNLRLKSQTSIAELKNVFQSLVNQLFVLELQLEDEEQALLLHCFLLNNWETLVVFPSNSAANGKLNMVMIMDALFN